MVNALMPTRRPRRVLIGVGLSVLILLATVTTMLFALTERVGGNIVRIPTVFASLDQSTRPPEAPEQTFLLVGSDSRSETAAAGTRPENSIMIARIGADRNDVQIVSIPGAGSVDVPRRGPGTISSVYAENEPALLVETVEALTGWRVDHVAIVDFARFDTIVDTLGGVDIPEVGNLDGASTLAFLDQADRAADGGPDGRDLRQQVVLRATLSKVISSATLTDPSALLGLLDAISSSIRLDDTLSNGGLRSVAMDLSGVDPGDFTLLRAPAELNGARAAELWAALRDGTTADYALRHPEDLLGPAPS